jgi:predicted small lipoprotein YifL
VFGNGLPTQCRRGDAICYAGKPFGTRVLARIRLIVFPALALVAALGLSGCGREGPLELPPGPAPGSPQQNSQLTLPDGSPAPGSAQDTALKNGFDAQGNPVAAAGQKRPFILDPLLQ